MTQYGRLFTKLYHTAHAHRSLQARSSQMSLHKSDAHVQRLLQSTAQATIFGAADQLSQRPYEYRWVLCLCLLHTYSIMYRSIGT